MNLIHINVLTLGACLQCSSLTFLTFIEHLHQPQPPLAFKAMAPKLAQWKPKQKTSWLVRRETLNGIIKDNGNKCPFLKCLCPLATNGIYAAALIWEILELVHVPLRWSVKQ